MRKKHMRSIISLVLCFAMVLSLMFVSNVEASEKKDDSEPALEYVVIDNPSVTTPGTQKVVVGYSKGTVLTSAVLKYKNVTTGEEYSVEASDIQESAAVFEMTYEDDSWTGTYSIEDITYTVDGAEYSLNFAKCGIEGKFAVNQICETDPDAVVEGEKTEENTDVSDADVSFTAITQDGTVYEEDSIAEVINDAIDTQSADSEIAAYAGRAATRLVVVLDPGHGGYDPGAIENGTNEKTLTLSIAIGTGAADYARNYDIAKAAMDLALGRGGDQAVIKDGEKIYYYGGKSQQMEKNTRVKVRVKAHALRQILEANDNVLIMGHNLPDIDSFGSALGIYIIAKKFGKEAHIVFGEISSSVRPFMNRFIDKEEYPDDMFIKKEEAENYLTASTVVIVVDVNRPQRTECPQLLDKCKTIIVFDHHRRSSDTITGAVLSYVDPYASSASEMITEMIQYVDDGIKLKAFEADALYAGISIDTDGFNSKSGPRTFEAAAFLRRHGADVTRVRKMLRNDMNEYKAIASAVSKSEVYKSAFAITVFDGEGLESPTIGGAKAANQLLDISGIKASFVITQYEDKLYISARSIDEVNVQLVMEKLGGGGHMSIAGAQLTNCTIQQAVNTIKLTLDNMLAEGEI